LYATASASHFFSRDVSALVSTTLYEWIDSTEHFLLTQALKSPTTESVGFTMTVQGTPIYCLFTFLHINDQSSGTRWVQVKRNSTEMPVLMTDPFNMFSVFQGVRSSSLYYECNKIRVRNTRLADEIALLKAGGAPTSAS
jgi:hypothetical protein